MWICFDDAFVSAVQDRADLNRLVVRGRRKEHLQALFPNQEIILTPDADYVARVFVTREEFASVVNQRVAQLMLDKLGHSVDTVDNGRAAVEAVRSIPYDLVLMDVQMPLMDGLEATRQFRAKNADRNRGIPILAMTANAMQTHKEECLQAGMDDYVSKPVALEDLTLVISRWLEIRRKRAKT